MSRSNGANHSLRLNLDNEQHRRVEKVLAGLNLDVHKSINQFLVEAADAYISKLEGSDLTYDDVQKKADTRYLTMDDMVEMRREIKDELQKEMIFLLGTALAKDRVIQIPDLQLIKELYLKAADSTQTEENDADEADETTIGLASSWG